MAQNMTDMPPQPGNGPTPIVGPGGAAAVMPVPPTRHRPFGVTILAIGAGILAVLLEAARAKGTQLTNAVVKDLLKTTAKAGSQGRNAMDFPATAAQPNGAVGHGLVNVDAMFAEARQRGLV